MTERTESRHLRIPVRYVEGVWECALGGNLPVKPDSYAELVIARSKIADKAFLAAFEKKSLHKILDEGSRLLVMVNIKQGHRPSDAFQEFLIPFKSLEDKIDIQFLDSCNSVTLAFVKVEIGRPDKKQARRFGTDKGGLWLITQGVRTIGIASTTVLLPAAVSYEPVASLNHAYTKLSEAYESWRISHTGNVYSQVLFEGKNGRWYPLNILRNRALNNTEYEIAGQLWQDFLAATSHIPKPPHRK